MAQRVVHVHDGGVGIHRTVAVGNHVVQMAHRRGEQTRVVVGRGRWKTAPHDDALAVAVRAVAVRADRLELHLAPREDGRVHRPRHLRGERAVRVATRKEHGIDPQIFLRDAVRGRLAGGLAIREKFALGQGLDLRAGLEVVAARQRQAHPGHEGQGKPDFGVTENGVHFSTVCTESGASVRRKNAVCRASNCLSLDSMHRKKPSRLARRKSGWLKTG